MNKKTNLTPETAPSAGEIVETPAIDEHSRAIELLDTAKQSIQAALDGSEPVPGSTIVGGCRGYLGGIILEIESRSRDIARMKEEANGA